MNQTTSETAPASRAMPTLYQTPVPLHPQRHAQAGIKMPRDCGFARTSNAIIVTGGEMMTAARYYPIAFSSHSPAVPLAVLGLRDGENLFVNERNEWREDYYVPAYMRRYPFIFLKEPDTERLVLCIDEAADCYTVKAKEPFFENDKPSAALSEILTFCDNYQAQYEETQRFGQWLDSSGLLEEQTAQVNLDDGQKLTLGGFRLIDVKKLQELPDEQVLELHKKGWLPLLHFQLQSMANWQMLTRLMSQRLNTKKNGKK